MSQEIAPRLNMGGRRPGVWKFTTPADLLQWRERNNVSRADVARRLGVAFSAVERWEKGESVALPEMQRRLAELMRAESLEDSQDKATTFVRTASNVGDSAVLGTSAIVTEYIKHSRLSPEAVVKLARELRDALR